MSLDDVESARYGSDPTRLFLFTMGSKRWGYVGQDVKEYFYSGVTYKPDPLVEMDQFTQSLSELSTDINITISSASEVARLYIPYLPPEPLLVRVFRLHPDAAPGVYAIELIGEIVSSSFDEADGSCTLLCRLVSKDLSRTVPWCAYSGTCVYVLYGPGCRVDREQFVTVCNIVGGAGTAEISAPELASAGAGNPENSEWFRGGFVRHVKSNEVRFIVGHDGGPNIRLTSPFLSLQNGDEVRAYAGCNHERTHCGPRFNNLNRMLAFPWIPGKNPYTQSVFGDAPKVVSIGLNGATMDYIDDGSGNLTKFEG